MGLLTLNVWMKHIENKRFNFCKANISSVKYFISEYVQTPAVKCTPEVKIKTAVALIWKLNPWTCMNFQLKDLQTCKFVNGKFLWKLK